MYNRGFAPYRSAKFFSLLFGLMVLPLLLMAFPQSVHAQGACPSSGRDYGDAPGTYGIACATPSSSLRIGITTPTAGVYAECTTGRADCSAGENFLNPPPPNPPTPNPLTPIDVSNSSYVWTIPVSNTTGSSATLAGWIDFNANGVFDDVERVAVLVPDGTTAVTLTWSIPITASFNITTYVRLRLSPNAAVDDINDYGIGEVEDYTAWMLRAARCDPGTSFYYADGGVSPSGNGPLGDTTVTLVNVSTGATTVVNNPPAQAGTDAINGLAVDNSLGLIFFQNAGTVAVAPRAIYGYNVFTGQNFTVTDNASAAPLNVTLTNGWRAAAGAFANGKYYAGVDGDDSGDIWEITFNAAGTASVSSRRLLTNPNGSPNSCGGAQCNDFGDILIVGNRMYISIAQNTPPYHAFSVWDINSQLRLSNQPIAATQWDAFQLGRDGNGNMYAITSYYGEIYPVTNGVINYPGTPLRTLNRLVRDASECPITRTPTAVKLTSFSARTEVFDETGRGIAASVIGLILSVGFALTVWHRKRRTVP
jgi:hypothetical protein